MGNKISIVVPVHNAGRFIKDTVNSVLNQSYTDFELILVNDGSTDNSVDEINNIKEQTGDERIILINNENPGSAARARNAGVNFATGDYIAFLDADDLWHKDKLLKTKQFMDEKGSVFAFTSYEFADENGNGLGKIVKVPEKINYEQALSRTIIFTSTVMFDLSKIMKSDVLMPEIKSEDTATWWKILRTGVVANGLNENLVSYRRAGKSLSSNKFEAVKRIWNLYRKSEQLSVLKSAVCFVGWGFGAVVRRM